MKTRSNILAYWGVATIIFSIIAATLMSWTLYHHTVDLLTENLKQRLLSIVTTAVVQIDASDLEELQVEDDWKKPEWKKVVNQLLAIENNNSDILFAYIFRKRSDNIHEMEFVADSHSIFPYANVDLDLNNDVDANKDGVIEPDGPDLLQWPGQEYSFAPADAFEAYNGPLTNRDLYEDAFGKVITGYAPIYNSSGSVAAILALDIRAGDFSSITQQTLRPFLLFMAFLILLIIVLAGIIINAGNKSINIFAELDRQKDELLSMVSHQMATPIASLKWYAEMLLDGDLGKISKKQKDHISSMSQVAAALSDLVSMILDVSRIELGKIRIEKQKMDINKLLQEIRQIVEPRAQSRNITIESNLPKNLPEAYLDRRYTHMIFENLLTNAIKYSPEGSKVEWVVKMQGSKLHVTVKDSGCGIPKEDQSKIFSKLYRATNIRNKVDGNGFGLFIVKGATEAQGGEIWFESQENVGSTFYFVLPIR